MISSPLCLYDCDVPADGSTVVIVSAPTQPPTCADAGRIESVGTAITAGRRGTSGTTSPPWLRRRGHDAAHRRRPSRRRRGQSSDSFSFITVCWLEPSATAAGRGPLRGGGERIALDGPLPLNTLAAGSQAGASTATGSCWGLPPAVGRGGDRQVARRPPGGRRRRRRWPLGGCLLLTRGAGVPGGGPRSTGGGVLNPGPDHRRVMRSSRPSPSSCGGARISRKHGRGRRRHDRRRPEGSAPSDGSGGEPAGASTTDLGLAVAADPGPPRGRLARRPRAHAARAATRYGPEIDAVVDGAITPPPCAPIPRCSHAARHAPGPAAGPRSRAVTGRARPGPLDLRPAPLRGGAAMNGPADGGAALSWRPARRRPTPLSAGDDGGAMVTSPHWMRRAAARVLVVGTTTASARSSGGCWRRPGCAWELVTTARGRRPAGHARPAAGRRGRRR